MKSQTLGKILGTLAFFSATAAQAAVVVTAQAANKTHSVDSGYPSFWSGNFPTAGNVLQGLAPAATGLFAQPFGGMNLAAANDGNLTTIPANGTNLSMFAGVGPGAGTQLIFTLQQATYISSIGYFGGWVDDGRSDINFTVSYSTDNGVNYTALIDAAGGSYSTKDDPTDVHSGGLNSGGTTTFTRALGGAGPISTFVSVVDNSSAYFGNNAAITHLKFDFGAVRNNWSGLEELTATGVAAVPEPGVWSLGLLAVSAGFLRRRRC